MGGGGGGGGGGGRYVFFFGKTQLVISMQFLAFNLSETFIHLAVISWS